MENNNRTIIAIVLIVLLWSGYSLFFAPKQQPLTPPTTASDSTQQVEQPVSQVPAKTDTAEIEKSTRPETPRPVDYVERLLTVSTENYDLQLSTIGATIRSMTLKKYRETNAADAKPYQLIEPGSEQIATIRTSGSEGLSIPADLPYQLEGQLTNHILVEKEARTIKFSATTTSGLTIQKSYVFYPESYEIDVKVDLLNGGAEQVKGVVNMALVAAWDESKKGDHYNFVGPITFDGEKLHEDTPSDLAKAAKIYGGNISWSGYVNKYFLMITSPQNSAMKQIQVGVGDGFVENKVISPFITLDSGQRSSFEYVSFFGPKDYDLLQVVGHQFERAIDYGFFRILAHPLMIVLKFFYSFIGNYGLAIILLTICIKIIFWPLTQKSYSSMKGMQKLQPEMQKLREKYANDKQRLNQEMMAFYKENRVNPLGGCLPMLIQIPVFFALYRVLLGSIELRHAPFMLWITDLSAADTLFTDLLHLPFTLGPLPLIMGFTMFLQQKMTPTNMDPTQAKIMNMMPVVFTFLFLSFPSGLVIYWLVNNLLTILQQYLIRRQPT